MSDRLSFELFFFGYGICSNFLGILVGFIWSKIMKYFIFLTFLFAIILFLYFPQKDWIQRIREDCMREPHKYLLRFDPETMDREKVCQEYFLK